MTNITYRVDVQKKGLLGKTDGVRVQVSLFNEKHSGTKFAALMHWAKQKFQHVTISLGDSLQRYNLQIQGYAEDTARQMGVTAGDAWIEVNKTALQGVTVSRWDEWLNHAQYKDTHAQVMLAFQHNPILRERVTQLAKAYLERKAWSVDDANMPLATTFLLEELAVFALQHRYQPVCEVYAGTSLPFKDLAANDDMHSLPMEIGTIIRTKVDFVRAG